MKVRIANKNKEESKMITITCIILLPIHSNSKRYGPYSKESGVPLKELNLEEIKLDF